MKTLDDLTLHFLQDIYYAERQLLKALPKMAKAAHEPALKEAFLSHKDETVHQIERLDQVFEKLGQRPMAIPCEAIKGLIEDGDEVVEQTEIGPVRDAGLAACGQAVEHDEMARYTAIIGWAKAGGHADVIALLQETLDEEKKAEHLLSGLSAKQLNKSAAKLAA